MTKTAKLIFAAFSILIMATSTHHLAAQNREVTDILLYLVEGTRTESSPGFRAPALIPVNVLLIPTQSSLVVSPKYDMGLISVSIENITTGDTSFIVISSSAPATIPFNTGRGEYQLVLTLQNGVEYRGVFEIQ
jgi:hypothetical protein